MTELALRPATTAAKASATPGTYRAVLLELRCAGCGYGVVVSSPPSWCPMCRLASCEPVEPAAGHR